VIAWGNGLERNQNGGSGAPCHRRSTALAVNLAWRAVPCRWRGSRLSEDSRQINARRFRAAQTRRSTT